MDSNDFSQRRRAARTEWLDDSVQGQIHSPTLQSAGMRLQDISELGARVSLDADARRPEQSSRHQGTLTLGSGFKCPLRFKVAFVAADTAGLEFIDQPREFHHLVRAYFRHELLGAQLRLLRSAGRKDILRFSDEGPNWLEIGLQAAEVDKFSADLTTLGHHVRWSAELPELSINSAKRGTEETSSLLPRELLRVIRNVPELNEGLKKKLETVILSSAEAMLAAARRG